MWLPYLCAETEVSPNTGLKDVPGASSARLETAPFEKNKHYSAPFMETAVKKSLNC